MASGNNTNATTPSANTKQTTPDDPRAELNAQIEDLLNTLSNKFAGVSSEIFAKMDEMSRRLDTLEQKLMTIQDPKKPGS
ncbi:hypothetical protein QBC35DRAFT_487144, partial [Podospora australis]